MGFAAGWAAAITVGVLGGYVQHTYVYDGGHHILYVALCVAEVCAYAGFVTYRRRRSRAIHPHRSIAGGYVFYCKACDAPLTLWDDACPRCGSTEVGLREV